MSNDRFETPLPVAKPWLPAFDDFVDAARDIFERRFLSNFATYAQHLEERATSVLGCDASAVSSCDIGMTLAWRAMGMTAGEVIVPSFTLASTVNAIVWNGLTPVFADVDPTTLCVDPADVAGKMTPRTVGIVGVHVFGEPVSEELDQLASAAGTTLLFDAAHGIGTTVGGATLASRGNASVFSLSGTKLVTAGEGGIATFRDEDVAARFRLLRSYGFGADYRVSVPGLNGKMSELNAALGYLSFEMLDEMVERRTLIAARYRRGLEGRHGVTMQPAPPEGETRSYKDLVMMFADESARTAVQTALTSRRVETKRYFVPVHTMPAYRHLVTGALPRTDDVWSRALCLPIFHDLRDEQIDSIIETIESVLSSR